MEYRIANLIENRFSGGLEQSELTIPAAKPRYTNLKEWQLPEKKLYKPKFSDDRKKTAHLKVYCDGWANLYESLETDRPTNRGKGGYHRDNTITNKGYMLRSQAVRKIKSCIFYRFWKTKKNKYNRLKFFTFTIQEKAYNREIQNYIADYNGVVDFTNGEKSADQFFIKRFSMFLESKMKTADLLGYVWIAEKTKKGVIHFHAIMDTGFLNAKKESKYWAKLCQMENFDNSIHFGFENTPGKFRETRIRSPRKLANYLTKYIAKGAIDNKDVKDSFTIYGRAYGMSRNFSNKFEKSFMVYKNVSDYMGVTGDFETFYKGKIITSFCFYESTEGVQFFCYLREMEFYDTLKDFFPDLYKSNPPPSKKQRHYEMTGKLPIYA